jgi:hypothetical protein
MEEEMEEQQTWMKEKKEVIKRKETTKEERNTTSNILSPDYIVIIPPWFPIFLFTHSNLLRYAFLLLTVCARFGVKSKSCNDLPLSPCLLPYP